MKNKTEKTVLIQYAEKYDHLFWNFRILDTEQNKEVNIISIQNLNGEKTCEFRMNRENFNYSNATFCNTLFVTYL